MTSKVFARALLASCAFAGVAGGALADLGIAWNFAAIERLAVPASNVTIQ